VATLGYDYGFEDLLKVRYGGSGTSRLGANGGYVLALGAAVPLRADGTVDLRATAGLKYDSVSGSSGSAWFLGFPVALMLGATLRPVRLSAGPLLLLGSRLGGDGYLADATCRIRTSLGFVGQLEAMLPLRGSRRAVSLGARYTWQKLQASTGGNAVDASALGLFAGVVL
jgi:hypothetical protein